MTIKPEIGFEMSFDSEGRHVHQLGETIPQWMDRLARDALGGVFYGIYTAQERDVLTSNELPRVGKCVVGFFRFYTSTLLLTSSPM